MEGDSALRKGTTYNMNAAMEWVRTDVKAVRNDVSRLGLDGAVEYQMDLVEDRKASGDHRYDEITPEQMRKAVEVAQIAAHGEGGGR
jgi:D-mannonate dehydratase